MILAALAFTASASWCGEGVALDAGKYPQDTPKKALTSILKALDKRDFEYWILHLIVPADSKRIIAKHGSLASATLMNADDKHKDRIQEQMQVIREMLKADKTTEGTTEGVKWIRYMDDEKVLQLDQQPDGRWCMNTRITKEK